MIEDFNAHPIRRGAERRPQLTPAPSVADRIRDQLAGEQDGVAEEAWSGAMADKVEQCIACDARRDGQTIQLDLDPRRGCAFVHMVGLPQRGTRQTNPRARRRLDGAR